MIIIFCTYSIRDFHGPVPGSTHPITPPDYSQRPISIQSALHWLFNTPKARDASGEVLYLTRASICAVYHILSLSIPGPVLFFHMLVFIFVFILLFLDIIWVIT